ncbi:MAG: aldo/keto reductase [Miltoncostaeaceae bacterium]
MRRSGPQDRALPRRLGDTGLRAGPLGLGMAALGRPGYITIGHAVDFAGTDPAAAARRAYAVLDEARALGVVHIDAARSYGRAEQFLAGWLTERAIVPGEMTISSKWGYTYTADWRVDAERHEVKDHTPAALERQWPESRALLGRWLGLYQIHSATPGSGVLDDATVLDRLASLRDGGLVIGLTTSGPEQGETIRRALGIRRGGRRLFGAVQATWNPLETSAAPALAEAHAEGVGVIVKEALANGRLALRPGSAPGPHHRALVAAVPGAADPAQAALALAMAQPFADVVLSGAATVEHLRDNAGATGLLRAADPRALDAAAEDPGDYWATRAALPWN